jgi:enamine deaminase RidA (YjgF/YER057c/UK114 family)
MRALQPPGWAQPRGYANGIAATLAPGSTLVCVGGQIGWDAQQRFTSDDFIAQCEQALANCMAVLAEAGGGPADMLRMTWYIVDRDEYVARLAELGSVYRKVVGRHYPAMSCVEVARLVEPRAKVEIEVTALVRPPSGAGA